MAKVTLAAVFLLAGRDAIAEEALSGAYRQLIDQAAAARGRLVANGAAAGGPVSPPIEPGGGLRSSVAEYRIDARLEEVWEFYVVTPMARLLPQGLVEPTLRPYRVLCPDRERAHRPDRVWPELQPGLQIQGFLHWGVTNIHQDMDVTDVQRLRRIEFRYGERAPAEGLQYIEFHAETLPSGASSVRVVHASRYRGKNLLYQSMYDFVHGWLLDSWHLSAKRYLEARSWAGSYCGESRAPPPDPKLQDLLQRVRRRVPGGRELGPEKLARAACLFSQRRLGLVSAVVADENRLADWVGGLAVALERDESQALRLFTEDMEAESAARQAAARACRP